ncbi:acetylornithine deacetylase [Thioclava dalianensis]|uniref:Acetylornithine deacetylase n=1 Tax=Thioclava dalianensis TaxID=1185766 RepID=A0A074U6T1_9RHOB|nr:acetylornithine deacetylase [Thioclava dalianensis]KEP70367.1 acetylornithine deacetylase [Thioclava dalianensis]SFN32549.1 acetylornithine deacetylase [Thioclava dalianensis]
MELSTKDILAALVGFPTITDGPNGALVDWVEVFLKGQGFATWRVESADGVKAGLLAKRGSGEGGLLCSAHSDVVPVAGQDWSRDPFVLGEEDGRYVGRGTTDMKGFLACVLSVAQSLRPEDQRMPLSLALSWDEEIGCRGIAEMIDAVIPTLGRPELCIVGEPTSLKLVCGHKGKASYRAVATGDAGHSAMAPQFRNALHPAADLVQAIRDRQAALVAQGARDAGYDPPFSTIHAGVLRGGTALNIVPDRAELLFEIRHLATETPEAILASLDAPRDVSITQTGRYPGLLSDADQPAIRAFASGLAQPEPGTVAFGTEAGFFAALGLPTIVWGPGDMRDGHQPDESVAISELDGCIRILRTYLSR